MIKRQKTGFVLVLSSIKTSNLIEIFSIKNYPQNIKRLKKIKSLKNDQSECLIKMISELYTTLKVS